MTTAKEEALKFYLDHLMIPHSVIDNKFDEKKVIPKKDFHYEWSDLKVKEIPDKGKAVFAERNIPANTLIPYIGVGYLRSMFPRTFLRAFADTHDHFQETEYGQDILFIDSIRILIPGKELEIRD